MKAMRRNLPLLNLVLIAAVFFVMALLLTNEQERNTRIEETARVAKAAAAESKRVAENAALEQLRDCIRANINAAIAKITATGEQNSDPAFERLASALYPILDCKRSQETGKSQPLSGMETSRYVGVVLDARFPIVRDGRVIGSRPSLLQGVDSLGQVGVLPEQQLRRP